MASLSPGLRPGATLCRPYGAGGRVRRTPWVVRALGHVLERMEATIAMGFRLPGALSDLKCGRDL